MEAAEFFETSVTFYQIAWRHIPEDCYLYIYWRQNVDSGETKLLFSNIKKDLRDK
jgi:hypothetical protein